MVEIINVQKRNKSNFIENTTRFKCDLFIYLWPGDFWNDYISLNESIEDYNEIRKKKLQQMI